MKTGWKVVLAIVCLALMIVPWVMYASIPTPFAFGDTPLNKGLPDDFTRRVLWSETDVLKYNIEQLVGHVLVQAADGAGYARGLRLINPAKPPVLKAIDGGVLYSSKIDSRAGSQGSYLAFAANMAAEETASVTIVDTAQSFVPYEDIPIAGLIAESKKPKAAGSRRFYVQGVLLATVTVQYGTKIDASASGVVGDTFGAKGNVYNEQATVSKDVRLSLLLLDVDQFAALAGGPHLRPEEQRRHLRAAAVDGFGVESIRDMDSLVAPLPR